MATTKKSTKGRKKSRKYMKRAARRTLAALLMITALIVAAIPATPGSAAGPANPDSVRNRTDENFIKYDDIDNRTRYYFERVTNPGISDAIAFIGFDTLEIQPDGSKIPTPVADITDISFSDKIVITEQIQRISENGMPVYDDGGNPVYDEEQKEFVCVSVAGELVNYDKIRSFSCPTVQIVNKGFAPNSAGETNLESFEGSGVTEIEADAFKNCTKLSTVYVGADAESTTVGNSAFEGCTGLTLFEGRNTKNVGNRAFYNCNQMKNCYVSTSVERIGDNAFSLSNMENFPDLTITSGIGREAFSGTQIKNLNITGPDEEGSDTAVALNDGIFKDCKSLGSVEFTGKFSSLGSDTFNGCESLQHVKLANPMKDIGSRAFDGCSSLNSLVLPGKITGGSLPAYLLKDCTGLEVLTLKNDEYDNQDIDISNIFDPTWLKSEDCNLIVEGYRNYKNEAGNTSKSKAYTYCIKNKIPYKCLDAEEGWADAYFDVDKSGRLLYVDVEGYFNDNTGYATDKHIDVPASVHEIPVNGIATDAFKDAPGQGVKTISTNSAEIRVEKEAFNINGLIYVRFAEGSSQVIDDSDNVFPKSNFYIYGDIETDSADTLNALEYATKYNVEYRGSGTYPDDTDAKPLTLVVKPVDGQATLVGALPQGAPSIGTGAAYVAGKAPLRDLQEAGAYINLPSGITSIDADFFRSDSYLRKVKTEGLTGLKDNQFQACTGILDADIGGSFTQNSFGKLPFQSSKMDNISIRDNNSIYEVDGQGIIYESFDNGKVIVEAIESGVSSPEGINGNVSTRYTTPADVVGMRDSAFEGNQWLRTLSTVYDNNSSNSSKIKTIPKRAFYDVPNLALVTLGVADGKGFVEADAFNYYDKSQAYPDMQITVYNERMTYDTSAFADSDRIYNFYSKENDDTYDLCEVLEKDVHDNLIWHDIGTVATKSLEGCEVIYPKGDTRNYKDGPFTFTKGSKINPTSPDCCDIAVQDASGQIINPDYYVLIGNLSNVAGNPNYDYDVPFIVQGDGTHYSANSTLDGNFTIVAKNPGGGGALEGFEITFANGNTTFDYTGNDIPIKALDTSAATGNDGEFYVWNRSTGEVLKNGTDYTFSPQKVKNKGTYTITVIGSGSKYAGGKLTAEVEVDDGTGPTPPGPTPPTPGTLVLRKITYPETSDGGQTRLYKNGREYVMSPGYDFVVWGSDDKVVDPGEYEVKSAYTTDGKNLMGVKGDPEKTIEIPFTVETSGNPSSNYAKSSIPGKFIIIPKEENDGDFNIKLPGIDDLGFAEWTGGVIEPEPVVYLKTDSSTILEVIKDYTVGYPDTDDDAGPNNKDMGTNKGVVYVYGAGKKYAGKSGRRYFSIRKSIPYYVTSDDNRKKITFTVTNGRYYTGEGEIKVDEDVDDSTTKKEEGKYSKGTVNADVVLTDATTGKKLMEGVDYTLSFKKEKGMNGTVTVTGMGNYFGSYTSAKFPLKKESKSSSSSSGGGSSSNSSSNKSSSSSSSSRSSSSSMGGSSSSSGTGSSSGANRNSGTTVINRNYYGPNGGTVDELQDMLRAAHIDSINGGTADGYQVNITKSDAAEQAFRDALIRRYGSLDNIRYFSMDISVRDQNGNPIDTSGMSVTLTLPLPTSMQQYGTNNKIATVDSAGDLEDLNEQFSTLEGRPCVTFVAPHFSPYGFYVNTADLAIGTLDNTPKTGDPIHPKWFLSFGLAALSIFLFLKRDPKPRVSAA